MAARIKTACCIHSTLASALAGLGIRTVTLNPPAGVASLPELLATLPEPPDCVIQQESLGARLLLTDLDAAPCPTIFWALDPHLNFFWQRHYARLFSAVATTQPHLTEAFAAAGAARSVWLPWYGQPTPFVPHARRRAAMAFVGRITPQRRRRQWFAAHMARHDLLPVQGLDAAGRTAAYDDARLAPNELIAGEVNQRLFEAASSGCLPVSERRPEAVAELFVPDREALYFDDVLELDERIRFALAHPGLTEKMALAAREAVEHRHLAHHRAGALLDLAGSAGSGATGQAAREAGALTLYHLFRCGQGGLDRAAVWGELAGAPPTPDIVAALADLAVAAVDREAVLGLSAACRADPVLVASPRSVAACTLAACRLGEMATAERTVTSWAAVTGRRRQVRLTDPFDYLLFFAAILEASGAVAARGMDFDPKRHLPDNASQCLIAAKTLRPDDLEVERRLERLLRRLPGSEAERVGLLCDLALHQKENWALGLELGLANLGAFRREAGLEEVALAAETARRLGQETRFASRLAQADPSGRLRQACGEGMPPAAGRG